MIVGAVSATACATRSRRCVHGCDLSGHSCTGSWTIQRLLACELEDEHVVNVVVRRELKTRKRQALYEPVHGSAPDIAGREIANPIAMIASFGMALRYSFGMGSEADMVEAAIASALDKGLRTADIAPKGTKSVGTAEMGQAIIGEMETLAAAA